MSGRNILLPPRVQLRDLDNASGSYPSISRVGDERTGKFDVFFDDTKSLIFATGVQIALPSGLPSDSQFLQGQTSSFDSVTGVVRKGVGDLLVRFTPGQSLAPFDESKHHGQGDDASRDPFHLTGSEVENVGIGFTSPLKSKTKLIIDLNPEGQRDDATGTSVSLQFADGSPMAYFNFDTKRYEKLGPGNDWTSQSWTNIQNYQVGFAPNQLDTVEFGSDERQLIHGGRPMTNFGFPSHSRYHATGSQLLDMSQLITKPFLLEKIVYELSASYDFDSGAPSNSTETPGMFHFFIMNQRQPMSFTYEYGFEHSFSGTFASVTVPNTLQLSPGGPDISVDTGRDLVTWASAYISQVPAGDDLERISRDFNITDSDGVVAIANSNGGMKIIMSASCRAPVLVKNSMPMVMDNGNNTGHMTVNHLGSRNGRTTSTGRDFITAVYGQNVTASNSFTSAAGNPVTINFTDQEFVNNPYLLLPTDKLIFGLQVGFHDSPFAGSLWGDVGNTFRIAPGIGRLTLYGSQVRENQEFHDTLNQLLTSDAVHESIHFDNPVIDQFDTEPRELFSGSYIGEHVTGTFDPDNPGTFIRRVATTTVASGGFREDGHLEDHVLETHRPRGFLRGVQLASGDERFFDTLLPRVDGLITTNGSFIYSLGGTQGVLRIGHQKEIGDPVTYDTTWNRMFPYESKYSAVPRVREPLNGILTTHDDVAGTELDNPKLVRSFSVKRPHQGTPQVLGFEKIATNATGEDLLINLFGVGHQASGTVDVNVDPNPFSRTGRPSGFKYGVLNARPQFSAAIYRYDRYGQLRDMLEQRSDSKFIGATAGDILDGPVQIRFVDLNGVLVNPYLTSGSNMSNEATSSVPYFDDTVRNREDPLFS